MTLGNLGSDINQSWHGGLHYLYDDGALGCSDKNPTDCDDMSSPLTSHINRNFYLVHGVIDNGIDAWLQQNGYETASTDCAGQSKCYQWKGLWDGQVPPVALAGGPCETNAPSSVAPSMNNSSMPAMPGMPGMNHGSEK